MRSPFAFRSLNRTASVAAAFGAATLGLAQISISTLDDFQDLTVMGWGGGASPLNQPTGGPGGAGDAYLEITSTGGIGAGSKLATNNFDPRWTGNWQSAGVQKVKLMIKNFSGQPLSMRIVLFQGLFDRFTSMVPVVVLPNQDWTAIEFPVGPNDLTRVAGSISYGQLITQVDSVMVRHDEEPPGSGGDPIVAQAGLDNIAATGTVLVPPTSLTVNFGRIDAGGLASLAAIDNDVLRLCKFFVPNQTVPIVQWLMNGTSPVPGSGLATGRVRSTYASVNAGAATHTMRLFNWSTQAFEESRTDPSTLSFQTLELSGTGNLSRYVGPNREVRARFEIRQTGPSTALLPCFKWDQTVFVLGN